MEKVSVEAFDRTAAALIRVIREDAAIIDDLKAKIVEMAENGRQRWSDYEKTFLEFEELKSKVAGLLELCDEHERSGRDAKLSDYEIDVNISEIRERLGA